MQDPALSRRAQNVITGEAAQGGTIIHYGGPNQNIFGFHCPIHDGCVVTRTSKPRRVSHKGRPLGYGSFFIANACDFLDSDSHKSYRPTFLERRQSRHLFRLACTNFFKLESKERKVHLHEDDSEPSDCP